MTITIASGKGGTGKTTVAVNLAYALGMRERARSEAERVGVRLLDCDVEEPNDHLFVRPEFDTEVPVTVRKPVWDAGKCTGCGACAAACNYNALAVVKGKVLVFGELCHSCGVCSHVCPVGAFTERDAPIGTVQVALDHAPFGFAHGKLAIGEALAPNVVRAVKAHGTGNGITLIDASPGTACPVVEAVKDADAALLVTEPTPFGLNDLKLALGLTLRMGVPTGIVVNRSDGEDRLIADYAAQVGVPIAGRIPFRREYAEAYSEGAILVERFPELRENLLNLYDHLTTAQPPVPPEEEFELVTETPSALPRGTAQSYREVTVISGKGGTGKTTVVGSLAQLADNAVLADNDVDAADLHLLLNPGVREAHDFVGGTTAWVDPEKCVACGRCAEACHFDAIRFDGPAGEVVAQTYRIDPLACEGCGLCPLVCPADAIRSEPNVTGRWYVSSTQWGAMAHARLGIAEENSGRLVTQVRNRAAELAADLRTSHILGDGPPGTGCPVIASVSGTDLVVIVTEPTVSGVHDMERVLQLAAHFGVPAAVIVNKADLNTSQAQRIAEIANAHNAPVLGHIPFDRAVNDALMAGKTVVEHDDGPAADAIRELWARLRDMMDADRRPAAMTSTEENRIP